MIIKVIRIFLITSYFLLTSVATLLLCLLRPFHGNNSSIMAKMYGFGIIPLMGVKPHYHHAEKTKNFTGPAIIIGNHQENFDIFLIGGIIPSRTVSIGKRSLAWIPIFGIVYWLGGNILLNRKNKQSALGTMENAGKLALKKDLRILVMPEGTRSRGKEMGPFKKGAFFLAIKFKIPIILIAVQKYSAIVDLKNIKRKDIHLDVVDIVKTDHYESHQLGELLDLCHQKIAVGIEEMERKNA